MEKTTIVMIIALVIIAYFFLTSTEGYQSSIIDPGFGQQLGALEVWHQKGYVSPDCMKLAGMGMYTPGHFGALVSCLQNDSNKPAIRNLM